MYYNITTRTLYNTFPIHLQMQNSDTLNMGVTLKYKPRTAVGYIVHIRILPSEHRFALKHIVSRLRLN